MEVQTIPEIKERYKDLLENSCVKRMCEWYRTGPAPLVESEPMYDSAKYLENARRNAVFLPEKLDEIKSLREKSII